MDQSKRLQLQIPAPRVWQVADYYWGSGSDFYIPGARLSQYDKGPYLCASQQFGRLLFAPADKLASKSAQSRCGCMVANSVSRTRARLSRLGCHISNKLCGPPAVCAPTRSLALLNLLVPRASSQHFRALNFCYCNSPLSAQFPISPMCACTHRPTEL